jgi:hypothetical protein
VVEEEVDADDAPTSAYRAAEPADLDAPCNTAEATVVQRPGRR